jgi:hypothetical protein
MGDEVLARLAALVGVVLAGEDEGALDLIAVDLHARVAGVLLDDREQVAEQPALERREVGALDRPGELGMLGAPDRAALGGGQSGAARLGRGRGAVPVALGGRGLLGQAAWAVGSVRNLSPSS